MSCRIIVMLYPRIFLEGINAQPSKTADIEATLGGLRVEHGV
jgi:hypothetical protein